MSELVGFPESVESDFCHRCGIIIAQEGCWEEFIDKGDGAKSWKVCDECFELPYPISRKNIFRFFYKLRKYFSRGIKKI